MLSVCQHICCASCQFQDIGTIPNIFKSDFNCDFIDSYEISCLHFSDLIQIFWFSRSRKCSANQEYKCMLRCQMTFSFLKFALHFSIHFKSVVFPKEHRSISKVLSFQRNTKQAYDCPGFPL